jgi:hypothetical protein
VDLEVGVNAKSVRHCFNCSESLIEENKLKKSLKKGSFNEKKKKGIYPA